jgi:hypothetical protein
MSRLLLHAFAILLGAVTVCGCSPGIDSPGVPASIVNSPANLQTRLVPGKNRLFNQGIAGFLVVKSAAKITSVPWFDDDVLTLLPNFHPSKVTAINLSIEGRSIAFSSQVIAPLLEPHWAQLRRDGKRTYLVIDGLDAAASYRAIFTIENGFVQQRLIAHGEFKQEIWERTVYHDDFDLHPDRYKNM